MAEHNDDSETIRQLMPQLLASARKKGVRAIDVEDVVHNAIVSGYKEERSRPRPSSKDPVAFTKWLFTLVEYDSMTYLTLKRRSRIDFPSNPDALQMVADTTSVTTVIDDRASVAAAFETLSFEEQELLVQHVVNDVPISDGAKSAGVPYSTEYSRVSRACSNLRDALERIEPGVNRDKRGRRSGLFIPFFGFEQTLAKWLVGARRHLRSMVRQVRMQAAMGLTTMVVVVSAAPFGAKTSSLLTPDESQIAVTTNDGVVRATAGPSMDAVQANGVTSSGPALQIGSSSVQSVKAGGQKQAVGKPSGTPGATKVNQWDLSSAVMAAQAIRDGDVRQAKRWLESDTQARSETEERLREKLQASMGARGATSRVILAGK